MAVLQSIFIVVEIFTLIFVSTPTEMPVVEKPKPVSPGYSHSTICSAKKRRVRSTPNPNPNKSVAVTPTRSNLVKRSSQAVSKSPRYMRHTCSSQAKRRTKAVQDLTESSLKPTALNFSPSRSRMKSGKQGVGPKAMVVYTPIPRYALPTVSSVLKRKSTFIQTCQRILYYA